jgi:hypothetical protein
MSRSRLSVLAVLLFGCAEPTVAPSVAKTHPNSPALTLALSAPEAVLPSGYAAVMGETNNSIPHTWRNVRYQQVFSGSDLIDSRLVKMCLRRDDLFGGAGSTQTLTIRLGPTSLDYTNLGSNFASNYSAPPTEVFSGDVVVPASSSGGTPADFDFCVPFTQQYDHTPGSNLIVEVINTSATLNPQPRDACAEGAAACTTARAVAFSATAEDAAIVQTGGLVVKFVSPEPPAPTDPVTSDDCKQGGWVEFGFRNQGQCVRLVETGVDSRSN